MKYILLFLSLFLAGNVMAQTLEEVSFGPGTNTHLTDINNLGYICGWYDSAGFTRGFVINPDGIITRSVPAGSTTVKFMGMNDHNVIVINYTSGSTITAYKAYYDPLTQTISPYVGLSGNQQPGLAQPFGINNNNDISGWYQGATYRFLWALHDSLPTTPQWAFDKYLTYNTIGGGINDHGTTAGYSISGSSYYAYLYDVPSNSFTILNTAFHMQPMGVNNNDVICGQYWQTSGYLTAFWGPVVNGIVTTHALNSLWANPNTQSVANGINDKNEVVGEYVHPTGGNWVGFIVRTAINEYRLPGYSWQRHTYNMVNSTVAIGGHPPVWSTNYYGNFNYYSTDPYANNGSALITPPIKAAFPALTGASRIPSTCVDWLSIATELDSFGVGTTPAKQAQYMNIWKPWAVSKWLGYYPVGNFPGICYGFAFTSLIRYADSALYQKWYGLPSSTNLYSLANNNSLAVSSIARTFFKQNDRTIMSPIYGVGTINSVLPWSGLFRLKNTYLDTVNARRNARAIFIQEFTTAVGYHSILPYKIHTPRQFPFVSSSGVQYDTLFVYDSNYPNDSTNFSRFFIRSDNLYNPTDSAKGTGHTVLKIAFNEAGINEMRTIEHGKYKTAGKALSPYVSLNIGNQPYFTMAGAASTSANYSGGTFSNNIPYLHEEIQKDTGFRAPTGFSLDTLQQVSFQSTHYADNIMSWNLSDDFRCMGINRTTALLAEKDNTTVGNHVMTYGTHDAVSKNLNAYFVQMNEAVTQGVNVIVNNLMVTNGDSLVTSNPSPYVYKITRITGAAGTYDLWVYVAGADDSVRQVRVTGIPLGPNTTHTISPYAGGPNGTQITIQIDKGNNGSTDSTITLGTSLGLNEVTLPAGFVKLYPNPVSNMLNLSFAGDLPQRTVAKVYDVTGKEVVSSQLSVTGRTSQISVSSLPAGTYLLWLLNENNSVLFGEKFIKQ